MFSRAIVGQMEMYVWGYSTDADDNVITAALPFGAFDFPFVWGEVVDPPPVGQQRTYYFGDYSSRATLAATGAFASYRAHYGLSDKEIHIIEDSTCPVPGANNSSAHFDPAPAFAQGLARIRIHTGQGSAREAAVTAAWARRAPATPTIIGAGSSSSPTRWGTPGCCSPPG